MMPTSGKFALSNRYTCYILIGVAAFLSVLYLTIPRQPLDSSSTPSPQSTCCSLDSGTPQIVDKAAYFADNDERNTFANDDQDEHWRPVVTVVTAYYRFPSKHSHEEYLEWVSNFLQIPCHLVLFCEPEMCRKFEAQRPPHFPTLFVEWSRYNWDMFLLSDVWEKQYALDPEKDRHRSFLLYAVWAQKAWFVKKAMELDPYHSEYFVWMDAGAFRDRTHLPSLHHWPRYERVVAETRGGAKVVAIAVNELPATLATTASVSPSSVLFVSSDVKVDPDSHVPILIGDYVGGTSFAASRYGWHRFRDLYSRVLSLFLGLGKFAGKDQTLYNTMCLIEPELFNLVDSRVATRDPWFYMQELLA